MCLKTRIRSITNQDVFEFMNLWYMYVPGLKVLARVNFFFQTLVTFYKVNSVHCSSLLSGGGQYAQPTVPLGNISATLF